MKYLYDVCGDYSLCDKVSDKSRQEAESEVIRWLNRGDVDFGYHREFDELHYFKSDNANLSGTFVPLNQQIAERHCLIVLSDGGLCLSVDDISIYFDTYEPALSDEIHLKLKGETVSIVCGHKANVLVEKLKAIGVTNE
jgi:hypothetical protein